LGYKLFMQMANVPPHVQADALFRFGHATLTAEFGPLAERLEVRPTGKRERWFGEGIAGQTPLDRCGDPYQHS
jgi:hypothetical protein